MKLIDPMGLLEFRLPPGWMEYPGSSTLFSFIFVPWTDDCSIRVESYRHRSELERGSTERSADAWFENVRNAVGAPTDAHVFEITSDAGDALIVHSESSDAPRGCAGRSGRSAGCRGVGQFRAGSRPTAWCP